MAKSIEIVVSPQGETTLQTKGFGGGDCLEASRWLENALGSVTADCKTPEYYIAQPQTQEIRE